MEAIIIQNKISHDIGVICETYLSANLPIEECSDLRSKNHIQLIKTLGKLPNQTIQEFNIINLFLNEEFGVSGSRNVPKFIVVRCQSGEPYDVHLIDLTNGLLISLFKKGDLLPSPLQNARNLAKNYNYAFVEVYEDKILLVR
jgi:hypothetical protein